jgi:hypothetical protein
MCGGDGCGGVCGTCAAASACIDGACIENGCTGASTELGGALEVSVAESSETSIAFDGVTGSLKHYRDVDPADGDGCIARVELRFQRGAGCELVVVAEGTRTEAGALVVTELRWTADNQCPGIHDEPRVYQLSDTLGTMTRADVASSAARTPGVNRASDCVRTTLTVALEGELSTGTHTATVQPTTLTVTGDLESTATGVLRCPL